MSEEDIQIIDFTTDKAIKKKKKGTKTKKAKTGMQSIIVIFPYRCRCC